MAAQGCANAMQNYGESPWLHKDGSTRMEVTAMHSSGSTDNVCTAVTPLMAGAARCTCSSGCPSCPTWWCSSGCPSCPTWWCWC
eukprot:11176210-Lingulodinium_polyedra.AAC.1